MTVLKVALPLLAIGSLAACGGASTGATSRQSFESANFTELANRADAIAESLTGEIMLTPDDDIPPTGNATYLGYSYVGETEMSVTEIANLPDDAPDPEILFLALADTEVKVDFSKGIDGATAAFGTFYEVDLNSADLTSENTRSSDFDGTAIAGTLALDPDTGTFSGSLTKTNGEVATYDLAILDYSFLGADADILDVVAGGTTTANGREARGAGFGFTGSKQ